MKTAVARKLRDPEQFRPLLAIRNEKEYDEAVARLNELVDEIGDHPDDARYRFIDTLSVLIEAYDREHYPIPDAPAAEVLRALMEEHGLRQSDLPEIGSQGVVSEILSGKRKINANQARALGKRFAMNPDVFL